MLQLFIAICGIILTIFFVVGIHEFGHFIVARWLGVKVTRFSIGFGKALCRWHDKRGTEYVLAPIPLGGYVKMLDENEEAVAEKDLPFAYNRQPLYKKTAIVLAGPFFNLMFAFLIYWGLFVVGFSTIIPIVGKVTPHSIAADAGLKTQDEILKINHKETLSWTSVIMRLLIYIGDQKKISVLTQRDQAAPTEHILDLSAWQLNALKPDPLSSLGIEPYQPNIPAVIGDLLPDSPAQQSTLQKKDKIIAINQKPIENWIQVLTWIAQNPEKTLDFTIVRGKQQLNLPVTIGYTRDMFLRKSGFLGLSPDYTVPKTLIRYNQFGPLQAFTRAYQNTYDFTQLNFLLLGKMLTGKMSFKSLGGPITIFESAGTALTFGMIPFLSFLAFLSIAIGVINILPIPGLDGGHLLFHVIEGITRRPLSTNVQTLLYRLGLIILLILAVQALANDIMRL